MAWVWPAANLAISAYSAFSQSKARKKTNEQEIELSNSAITRRMADAKRAGVNPALAYMGTGATTPNLEAPNFEALESIGRDVSSAYTQATQRSLIGLQKANMEAQNKLLDAQTAATAQQALKTKDEREQIIPATAANLAGATQNLEAQAQILAKEFQIKFAQIGLTEEQAKGEKLRNDQLQKIQPLLIEYQRYINKAEALGIPEKQATADFFNLMPSGKWNEVLKSLIWLSRGAK